MRSATVIQLIRATEVVVPARPGSLNSENVLDTDAAFAKRHLTGGSWTESIDNADWQDGEILALGTSPRGDIRRVFLGSRSAKIIRESSVPVLVLPG